MKEDRPAVDTPEALAAEFAAWRLGGCPGYGFADVFKVKVRRAARALGRTYSDLMTEVHREAYRVIDRGLEPRPRAPEATP